MKQSKPLGCDNILRKTMTVFSDKEDLSPPSPFFEDMKQSKPLPSCNSPRNILTLCCDKEELSPSSPLFEAMKQNKPLTSSTEDKCQVNRTSSSVHNDSCFRQTDSLSILTKKTWNHHPSCPKPLIQQEMTELNYPSINPNSQEQISNHAALKGIHSEKQSLFLIK